ncbi:MAG: ThuA domain-containing protein [Cyclobacteriaceae bacterium]|nr:ThuA domain-containing protein [Cyclobacteriaceae bacterium]
MKKYLLPLIALFVLQSCQTHYDTHVLVFTKTLISRHASISDGIIMIDSLANKNNWDVTYTEDANFFTENNLKDFQVVIFLNSSGDVFTPSQQADFQRFIQSGGGFVGVHAAATTEYEWPWFNKLLGAYFKNHPEVQEGTLLKTAESHPSTASLSENWKHTDEWYNFRNISPDINILLTLDEGSIKGGENGKSHPISWFQEFDGGKSFYTNLGHRKETYHNSAFVTHIEEGIKSVIPSAPLNYELAKASRLPKENRFQRTVLTQYLDEPMEIDLVNDNQILIIERKGALKMFDIEKDEISLIHHFDVFTGFEEGLIGIAVDPNYNENHWIYLFYSENKGNDIQNVSRFNFYNGKIDLASEKILLQVKVQREECCHVAGSMEFGPDGLLYIATGDNTNPFASDGFNPKDERPGRSAWDAQKSSANTNDLRGKILRIRPLDNGTYEIPEGNLYAPGTEKTQPEIYVMGLRNPFRIALDHKTGWLYWGDVGPDAGRDGAMRGPKGYDELNQARKAGFYGWPYTRGDNIPYYDYNFATQSATQKFDPQHIINDSPNNTGLAELPPVQPSLIYYSYDSSALFPWTGTGGKNPMAGPIYHKDFFYPDAETFPEHFEDKVFFYEWIRDWIYLIELDENGKYAGAEPFLDNMAFHNPMDMLFSKDGSLYILEYGDKWFSKNPEARLNKINYIYDNMKPIARFNTDKIVGGVPLTVHFDARTSEDYDGDKLRYEWKFEENSVQATGSVAEYTFNKPGRYKVNLTVKDPAGHISKTSQEILVGNSAPELTIDLNPEDLLFWDNKTVNYQVKINDLEDGSNEAKALPGKTSVYFQYIPQGEDLAIIGHQTNEKPSGLAKIEASDCKACHNATTKVNGPSYQSIAEKYTTNDLDYLVNKVINGGSGVWGETPMSAHPQLSETDVTEMVEYILNINSSENNSGAISESGTLTFNEHINAKGFGKYVLQATYEDTGANGIPSQIAQETLYFEPNLIVGQGFNSKSDSIQIFNNRLINIADGDYFSISDVTVSNINYLLLKISTFNNIPEQGTIELRSGNVHGPLVKSINYNSNASTEIKIEGNFPEDKSNELFFIINSKKEKTELQIDGVYINYLK